MRGLANGDQVRDVEAENPVGWGPKVQIMRLLDYYEQIINSVLDFNKQLEPDTDAGRYAEHNVSPSYVLFGDLEGDLKSAEAEAVDSGQKQRADAEAATRAIVAWIDDLLGQHTNWLGDQERLQRSMYDTADLGTWFVEQVRQTTVDQDELAEVLLVLLGLGFRGEYAAQANDGKRNDDITYLSDKLRDRLRTVNADARITPQPYEVEDPEVVNRKPNGWKWFAAIAASILVITLLVAVNVWFLSAQSDPRERIRTTVGDLVEQLKCSSLLFRLGEVGHLSASGRVPSKKIRDKLNRDLSNIDGVTKVSLNNVEVMGRPFCNILDFLENTDLFDLNGDLAPTISLNKRGIRPTYLEGENFYIKVKNHGLPEGHLHVVYFNIEGSAYHLLPGWAGDENMGIDVIAMGRPDGHQDDDSRYKLTIGKPLERAILIAIYSENPLFSESHQEYKSAETYIAALRNAVGERGATADTKPLVSVSYVILELRK